MELVEETTKEFEETLATFERGLVYRPEYNYAILTFLKKMLPKLQAGRSDPDVFAKFRKYWQEHCESEELRSSFAETNPLILEAGIRELCKYPPYNRKRILATLTARQAEQIHKRKQIRGRAGAVRTLIERLALKVKFLLVVFDELALLSQVDINGFEKIRAELREQSGSIINSARKDPSFEVDIVCSDDEIEYQQDMLKVFTIFLVDCYDLAKSINGNSHSEVDHASNL